MTMTREQVAALLDGTTPGPWDWAVNRQLKTVELSGKGGDLTVMSFARWGMGSAAPVFWFWKGNVSDEPKRADALAVPAPGRDHHKHWFARIDHPDAMLTAAAPDLARQLLAALDRLAAAAEAYEKGMDDAADKILDWLAKAVGAEKYSPCDGTDTWDGDVHGTIYAILKAGGVYDDEDGRVAKLADADMAQAALVERAAETVSLNSWKHEGEDAYSTGMDAGARHQAKVIYDAIRALAPDAGAQALAELRAENKRLTDAVIDAGDDRDRLAAKLAGVEAQVEALREALIVTRDKVLSWAHDTRDGVWTEEMFADEVAEATAALAAASPTLTPAEQALFDQSMAMREVAGKIAKEQIENTTSTPHIDT